MCREHIFRGNYTQVNAESRQSPLATFLTFPSSWQKFSIGNVSFLLLSLIVYFSNISLQTRAQTEINYLCQAAFIRTVLGLTPFLSIWHRNIFYVTSSIISSISLPIERVPP